MPRDHRNLVLLVGLTGVGKSTIVDALVARRDDLHVLPNRREIADAVILPAAQRREGRAPSPVRDRLERFRLTAVYRQMHPSGVAHALGRWLGEHADIDWAHPLLFDNLRGANEVRAALEAFCGARFLVLHASPQTRLARLVGRADPFDVAGGRSTGAATSRGAGGQTGGDASAGANRAGEGGRAGARTAEAAEAARAREVAQAREELATRISAIDGVHDVFDPSRLAAAALDGGLDADGLLAAVQIIVEEQRHYDSAAAAELLQGELPAERLRIVDTETTNPSEAVELVLAWLDEQGRS